MHREELLKTIPISTNKTSRDPDNPFIAAEIGVWKGGFSSKILNTLNPNALYLIDPWKRKMDLNYNKSWYGPKTSQQELDQLYEDVHARFQNDPKVKILRQPSEIAYCYFYDCSLDFIYLDADHNYSAVKRDLSIWFPKLKVGGVLMGDDFIDNNWWGDSIIKAFSEFNTDIAFTKWTEGTQYFIKRLE